MWCEADGEPWTEAIMFRNGMKSTDIVVVRLCGFREQGFIHLLYSGFRAYMGEILQN